MKDPKKKASFGIVLAVMLGMVLSGTTPGPNPFDYIAERCYDGINNDGDSDPFIGGFADINDQECIYMLYEHAGWASGEYDGQGLNPPPEPDIQTYVVQWNQSDVPTTHYDGVKALHDYFGSDVCSDSRVQNALMKYRDDYGIEDARTGVSQHQSDCGVSY